MKSPDEYMTEPSHRRWYLKRYHQRKAEGICVTCGEPADAPPSPYCSKCRQRARELLEIRNAYKDEHGLCRRCGKPMLPPIHSHYCFNCRIKECNRRHAKAGKQ